MDSQVTFFNKTDSIPSYTSLIDSYRGPSSKSALFGKQKDVGEYDSEIEALLGNSEEKKASLSQRIASCFQRGLCCGGTPHSDFD